MLVMAKRNYRLKKTREAAKEAGHPYYLTGLTCANGHTAKRYTLSGSCIVCKRDWAREERRKLQARRILIEAGYYK